MKTKHSAVRKYIEKKIKTEEYSPNEKIESENELMNYFNVSRHTVRVAVNDLVSKGWLYKKQGAGTFCAKNSYQLSQNEEVEKKAAIITTHISDYIFPSIIRGAEHKLSQNGYQVSLFNTDNSFEKEKKILEILLKQKFSGVIIEPTKSAISSPNISYYLQMEHFKIPYVMINKYYESLDPISIIVDDEKGGFIQTEHLIKNGHKNIIGIFKNDDMQGIKRMKGYIHAHRYYNIQIDPNYIITYETENKNSKPASKLKKILKEDKKVSSIVCYNDELAVNLLEILRIEKLRVPYDISIIGFDDSFLTDVSEVKLTSIKHPKNAMGIEAANKIIEKISEIKNGSKNEAVQSIIFPPEIVIRSSVRNLTAKKGEVT